MPSNYDYLTGRGDPSFVDMANEVVAGFVPGLGTAQALRDYKKASEDKDYLGMGLSALGSVPVLGGLAKTATLLPAILRMGKGAQIAEAEKLLKQGANNQELWDKTRLFKYPGQLTDGKGAQQARWGFELPPGKVDLSRLTTSPQTLDRFLDDNALFDAVPNLAFTEVAMGLPKGATKTAGGAYAHHEGPAGRIYINDLHDMERVLRHELNHGVNAHTSQLGSTGHVARSMSPAEAAVAREMAARLRKAAPDLTTLADAVDNTGRLVPKEGWSYSAGERLAEADAFRSKNYSRLKDSTPYFDMNAGIDPRKHTGVLIPDDVSRHTADAVLLHGDDPAEALRYLLRNLK